MRLPMSRDPRRITAGSRVPGNRGIREVIEGHDAGESRVHEDTQEAER